MLRAPLFVLFLAPISSAAPVPAAPKDGEPVPGATAKLLKYRAVQKELKMTAEQRINLLDTLEDIEEEHDKRVRTLQKMPNAPEEAFEKLEKDRQKAVEKLLSTTAEKALTAAQRTRLRQVGWQVLGPAAYGEPQLHKALQFDDDEKKAAASLAELAKAKADLYMAHLGDDDEDKVKAEVLGSRATSAKKFAELLTPQQREVWKAMLGEPVKSFDADELWLKVVEDEDHEN